MATQPRRVWVHTCTLDHPAALANYQARGMKSYKTEMENDPPKQIQPVAACQGVNSPPS